MKRDQTGPTHQHGGPGDAAGQAAGIVRESLQARAFGTQVAADLYTTANNNTIYLFTTVAYALCVAAVPILAPRLQRSREEGLRAAGNLITITVGVSVLVAAGWIAATFTPWVDALWAGTGGGDGAACLLHPPDGSGAAGDRAHLSAGGGCSSPWTTSTSRAACPSPTMFFSSSFWPSSPSGWV